MSAQYERLMVKLSPFQNTLEREKEREREREGEREREKEREKERVYLGEENDFSLLDRNPRFSRVGTQRG